MLSNMRGIQFIISKSQMIFISSILSNALIVVKVEVILVEIERVNDFIGPS
jgi:hypothetical protein